MDLFSGLGGGIGPVMTFGGGAAEPGVAAGGGGGGSGGGTPNPFDVRVMDREGGRSVEVYLPPQCLMINGVDHTGDLRGLGDFTVVDPVDFWYEYHGVVLGDVVDIRPVFLMFKVSVKEAGTGMPGDSPEGSYLNYEELTVSDFGLTFDALAQSGSDEEDSVHWRVFTFPLFEVREGVPCNLQGGAIYCVTGLTGDAFMCSEPIYDELSHQLRYTRFKLSYVNGLLVGCSVHDPSAVIAQAVPETAQVITVSVD